MKQDRWLIFGLGLLVVGISAFVVASLVLTAQHNARERAITDEAARSAAAARVAVEQAHHDRAFLFAICQALNQRDQISAWTTKALAATEMRYHPQGPTTELAYHAARERILAQATKERAAVASFDCLGGMVTAVKEAPTDPPVLEASATP